MITLTHPSESRLADFALQKKGAPSRRLTNHLARCTRCRAHVAFVRATVAAMSPSDAAPAPPDLIERVVAARAGGTRVILPVENGTGAASRTGVMIAAAAVLLTAGLFSVHRFSRPAVASDAPFLASGLFMIMPAYAAAPPALALEPPPVHFDGERLRPTRLVFENAGPGIEHDTFDLRPSRVAGVDAWRIVRLWRSPVEHGAETTFVTRRDLRPVSRTVVVAPELRLHQTWSDDTVASELTTAQSHKRFRAVLPAGASAMASDAIAVVAMRGVSLRAGWTGRVLIANYGWTPQLLVPVDLRVVGQETLNTPAGRFECWKLVVALPQQSLSYWVRKSDGIGVRSKRDAGPWSAIDRILVSEAPLP
jgi:hypothetical protein